MSKSEHIEGDSAYAPLSEVAAAYGVSVDTIRRRLRRGEMEGRRETTPQGFRWLAPLPSERADAISLSASSAAPGIENAIQSELIATLQRELELRNQEIARLHTVVERQAGAIEQLAAATLPAQAASASSESTSGRINTDAPVIEPSETLWQRLRRLIQG